MMLHAEPQSNIKDRIRLHYYLRDHLGNTVVAFDDRNYDACPPVWRGAISDVEEGTQSEVIGRYHYYSRRDLGSSVEEPLARPSPALERDAFGERGCASHTKWLVAEVKRSVCPAGRHGRSRSDSGVITLHARRHEVLMRKQWNNAWVGSDIGGYWQQRYRYNGKELHSNSGLLDYGFRYYDPSVGRFMGVDPLAEKMPAWSSYSYGFNAPTRFIDPDGRRPNDPGDLFKSPQKAAIDFGRTFNGRSIIQYREYGSTIYQVNVKGKIFYTYTEPAIGTNDGVYPSLNPNGTTAVAFVHSHGGYEEQYDNNNFSGDGTIEGGGDKAYSIYYNIDGYVTTPDGSVKQYHHKSNSVSTISTAEIPSDPKDPDRKNKIHPTEDPMVKDSINKINEAGGVLRDPSF